MRVTDVTKGLQDYTAITWSERASSSGTAGTYLKARVGTGVRARYLKLSRYNGVSIDGTECINELIASRLMEILGIDHVRYRLIHARVVIDGAEHITWLSSSQNFRRPGEQKMALGAFFELHRVTDETPLSFCLRMGWSRQISQMMLVDYLLANRDRHASNIEVIIDRAQRVRLAPFFDSGLSLVAPLGDDEMRIQAFKPLAPVATTNFIGSRSLEENVRSWESIEVARPLVEGDKGLLLAGLEDAASPILREKLWDIVWQRWCWYASL